MKSKRIAFLWIASAMVPLACVVLGDWLLQLATHRPGVFDVDPGVGMVHALLAAGPFLVLAMMAPVWVRTETGGSSTALVIATATGFIATACLWSLYYYEAYVYWRDDLRTGANIGLGCLMLVSPLLVGGAMAVAYRVAKWGAGNRSRACRG